MAQKPRPLQPDLSPTHLFGARLRQYRSEQGLSQQALGRLIHVSGDLIGKVEKGERRAGRDLAGRADTCLGAEGALLEVWPGLDADRGDLVAEGQATIVACLPALRRVLDAYDQIDDGPVPTVAEVRRGVDEIVVKRLDSQYLWLAAGLPTTLPGYLRALHASTGRQHEELAALVAQALRAADAIADKYSLFDLSARIIALVTAIAQESGHEPTIAAAAYIRAETFFAGQDYETGRRLLERAAGMLSGARTGPVAAAYGALHMRAAVLAARGGQGQRAHDHIAEASAVAARTPEGVYTGTAFGPTSVKIHQISLALDAGCPQDALRAASGWLPPRQLPAERRSHFFVDLADASAQCGHSEDALAALHVARRTAPQHVLAHPQARAVLVALCRQTPSRSPALSEFMRWTGVRNP